MFPKATLANGKVVDVMQDGAEVSFPRPRGRPELFKGYFRWRLAFAKANKHKKHGAIRTAIAGNIARQWNNEHLPEEQIESLDIYKMSKVLSKTLTTSDIGKSGPNGPPKKNRTHNLLATGQIFRRYLL